AARRPVYTGYPTILSPCPNALGFRHVSEKPGGNRARPRNHCSFPDGGSAIMFAFAFPWQVELMTRRRPRTILRIEDLEDRCVPSLLGQQLFPDDNPWNQPIANAPVAANSDAIINNILSRYGNGRLHPDFGQDYQNNGDLYGIPYDIVHGYAQPAVPVVIDA